LWMAAQMGHAGIVELLLSLGAMADREKTDGATPLFKAAHKGHSQVVALLLRHQPNLGLLKVRFCGYPVMVRLCRTVKVPCMRQRYLAT
jgi:hypothetical protein